ncbi:rRNA pseudouridine synthase [Candidatus Berkelbacteria bacterium]|nr:rRNA pseudouridine synthase [Candidatus Berkelbacteria bacterium]
MARRKADALIEAGRVMVNGRRALLGQVVDATMDHILIDGQALPACPRTLLYAYHKPRGVITTLSDPAGRATIATAVGIPERLFPVGRLDKESEGLLLLTNDGQLALELTHPRFAHQKRYRVWAEGSRTHSPQAFTEILQTPRRLDGRVRRFDDVLSQGREAGQLVFEVSVHEGLKHLVRRLFDRAGLTVVRLQRITHGPVELGDLAPGAWRELSVSSVRALLQNPRKS